VSDDVVTIEDYRLALNRACRELEEALERIATLEHELEAFRSNRRSNIE
jgi:hypothetical protein